MTNFNAAIDRMKMTIGKYYNFYSNYYEPDYFGCFDTLEEAIKSGRNEYYQSMMYLYTVKYLGCGSLEIITINYKETNT